VSAPAISRSIFLRVILSDLKREIDQRDQHRNTTDEVTSIPQFLAHINHSLTLHAAAQ
jgi:hypothetical protein